VQSAALQDQNAVAGSAKALERHNRQLTAIDEMLAQLKRRRENIVVKAFSHADKAWKAHHEARKGLQDQLFQQVEDKIAAMEAPATLPPANPAGPGLQAFVVATLDALPPAPVSLAASPVDELAKAREETRVTKEALEALQRSIAASRSQPQVVPANLALPCLPLQSMTLQLSASDLPTMLPEPQADQWPLYHRLWCTLEMFAKEDALGGPPLPITLAQLQAGVDIIKALVGDTIWSKAYPAGPPAEDALVTMQLRQLCWMSLNTFRDKLLNDKTKQEAEAAQAATHVQAVVTEARAKRRKAEGGAPLDVSSGAAGSVSSA